MFWYTLVVTLGVGTRDRLPCVATTVSGMVPHYSMNIG